MYTRMAGTVAGRFGAGPFHLNQTAAGVLSRWPDVLTSLNSSTALNSSTDSNRENILSINKQQSFQAVPVVKYNQHKTDDNPYHIDVQNMINDVSNQPPTTIIEPQPPTFLSRQLHKNFQFDNLIKQRTKLQSMQANLSGEETKSAQQYVSAELRQVEKEIRPLLRASNTPSPQITKPDDDIVTLIKNLEEPGSPINQENANTSENLYDTYKDSPYSPEVELPDALIENPMQQGDLVNSNHLLAEKEREIKRLREQIRNISQKSTSSEQDKNQLEERLKVISDEKDSLEQRIRQEVNDEVLKLKQLMREQDIQINSFEDQIAVANANSQILTNKITRDQTVHSKKIMTLEQQRQQEDLEHAEQLSSLNTARDNIHTKILDLEKKLSSETDGLDSVLKDLDTLQVDAKELAIKNQILTTQNKKLIEKLVSVRDELREASSKLSLLDDKDQELKKLNQLLLVELQKTRALELSVAEYQGRLEADAFTYQLEKDDDTEPNTSSKVSQKDVEPDTLVADFQNDLDNLSRELDDILSSNKIEASSPAARDLARASIAIILDEYVSVSRQLEDIQANIAEFMPRIEELINGKADEIATFRHLSLVLSKHKSTHEKLQAEIDVSEYAGDILEEKTESLEQYAESIKSTEAQLSALGHELDATFQLQQTLQTLSDRESVLGGTLLNLSNKLSSLIGGDELLAAQVQGLHQKLAEADTTIDSNTTHITSLKEDLVKAQEAIQLEKGFVDILESKLTEQETAHQAVVSTLKLQYEAANGEEKNRLEGLLQEKENEFQASLQAMQQQMDESSIKQDVLSHDVQSLTQQIQEKDQNYRASLKNNTRLSKEVKRLKGELAKFSSEGKTSQLNTKIKDLTDRLQKAEVAAIGVYEQKLKPLQSELERQKKTISELNSEIDTLQGNNASLQRRNEALIQEVSALKATVIVLTQELNHVQKQFDDELTKTNHLTEQLSDNQQQLASLQTISEGLNAKIIEISEQSETTLSEKDSQLSQLHQQLNENVQRISMVESTLSDNNIRLLMSQDAVKRLEKSLQESESSKAILIEKLNDSSRLFGEEKLQLLSSLSDATQQSSKLVKELSQLTEQLKQADRQNKTAQEGIKLLTDANKGLSIKIQETQDENVGLRKSVESLSNEVAGLHHSLIKAKEDIATKEREMSGLNEKLSNTEHVLRESSTSLTQLKHEMVGLQSSHEEEIESYQNALNNLQGSDTQKAEKIETLTAAFTEKEKRYLDSINSLNEKIEHSGLDKQALEVQIARLGVLLSEKTSTYEALLSSNTKLEKKIAGLSKKVLSLTKDNNKLKFERSAELEALKKDLQSAAVLQHSTTEQLVTTQAQLLEKTQIIGQWKTEANLLSQENDRLSTENRALSLTLKNQRLRIDDLEKQLVDVQANFSLESKKVADLNQTIASNQDELKKLSIESNVLKSQIEKLTSETEMSLSEKDNQLQALTEALKSKDKRIQEIESSRFGSELAVRTSQRVVERLKSDLKVARIQNNTFKDELQLSKENQALQEHVIDNLQQRLDELNSIAASANQENAALQREVAALTADNQALVASVETLTADNQLLHQQVNELSTDVTSLNKDLMEAKDEISAKSKVVEHLQGVLQATTTQLESTSQQIQTLTSAMQVAKDAYQVDIRALQSDKSKARDHIVANFKEREVAYHASIDAIAHQVEALSQSEGSLKQTISELQNELSKEQQAHRSLSQHNGRLQSEIAKLKRQATDRLGKFDRARNREIQGLQVKLAQTEKLATENSDRLIPLVTKLESQGKQIADLSRNIVILEGNNEALMKRNQSLKAEIEQHKAENSKLTQQVEFLSGEAVVLRDNLFKAGEDIVRKEQEVIALRSDLDITQDLLKSGSDNVIALSSQISELKAQHQFAVEAHEKALSQIDSNHTDEIRKLTQSFSVQEAGYLESIWKVHSEIQQSALEQNVLAVKIADLERSLNQKTNDNDSLLASNKSLSNKITELNNKVSSLSQEKTALGFKHSTELDKLKQEVKSAEDLQKAAVVQLATTKKELSGQKKLVSKWSEEAKLLSQENDLLFAENNTLKTKVTTLELKVESLHGQLEDVTAQFNTQSARVGALNETIQSNQLELTALKSESTALQSQIETLQQDSEQSLAAKEQHLQELLTQLQEKDTRIQALESSLFQSELAVRHGERAIERLKSALELARTENSTLAENQQLQENVINDLQQRLDDLSSIAASASQENAVLQQEVLTLGTKSQGLLVSVKILTDENQRLTRELYETKGLLAAEKDKVSNLFQDLKNNANNYDKAQQDIATLHLKIKEINAQYKQEIEGLAESNKDKIHQIELEQTAALAVLAQKLNDKETELGGIRINFYETQEQLDIQNALIGELNNTLHEFEKNSWIDKNTINDLRDNLNNVQQDNQELLELIRFLVIENQRINQENDLLKIDVKALTHTLKALTTALHQEQDTTATLRADLSLKEDQLLTAQQTSGALQENISDLKREIKRLNEAKREGDSNFNALEADYVRHLEVLTLQLREVNEQSQVFAQKLENTKTLLSVSDKRLVDIEQKLQETQAENQVLRSNIQSSLLLLSEEKQNFVRILNEQQLTIDSLSQNNRDLSEKNQELLVGLETLQASYQVLENCNRELQTEIAEGKAKNATLADENQNLTQDNLLLQNNVKALTRTLDTLSSTLNEDRTATAGLREVLREKEGQLLTSQRASKELQTKILGLQQDIKQLREAKREGDNDFAAQEARYLLQLENLTDELARTNEQSQGIKQELESTQRLLIASEERLVDVENKLKESQAENKKLRSDIQLTQTILAKERANFDQELNQQQLIIQQLEQENSEVMSSLLHLHYRNEGLIRLNQNLVEDNRQYLETIDALNDRNQELIDNNTQLELTVEDRNIQIEALANEVEQLKALLAAASAAHPSLILPILNDKLLIINEADNNNVLTTESMSPAVNLRDPINSVVELPIVDNNTDSKVESPEDGDKSNVDDIPLSSTLHPSSHPSTPTSRGSTAGSISMDNPTVKPKRRIKFNLDAEYYQNQLEAIHKKLDKPQTPNGLESIKQDILGMMEEINEKLTQPQVISDNSRAGGIRLNASEILSGEERVEFEAINHQLQDILQRLNSATATDGSGLSRSVAISTAPDESVDSFNPVRYQALNQLLSELTRAIHKLDEDAVFQAELSSTEASRSGANVGFAPPDVASEVKNIKKHLDQLKAEINRTTPSVHVNNPTNNNAEWLAILEAIHALHLRLDGLNGGDKENISLNVASSHDASLEEQIAALRTEAAKLAAQIRSAQHVPPPSLPRARNQVDSSSSTMTDSPKGEFISPIDSSSTVLQALDDDENLKFLEGGLARADAPDKDRWQKAIAIYKRERRVLRYQDDMMNQTQPQDIKLSAEAHKTAALAAIDVLMDSMRHPDATHRIFSMERLSPHGFIEQVVLEHDVKQRLGLMKAARADGSSSGNGSKNYFMNVELPPDKVILSTQTFDNGGCANLVQKHNGTVEDHSEGPLTDEQNEEIAMEQARKLIDSYAEGQTIYIRGKDEKQCQRLHAALLSLQSSLTNENPNHPIHSLNIDSSHPGPEAGKAAEFIGSHIQHIQEAKNIHKPTQYASNSIKEKLLRLKQNIMELKASSQLTHEKGSIVDLNESTDSEDNSPASRT